MKNIYKIIIYLSIIFLLINLYHKNYFHFPPVDNNFYLLISLVLLFSGFFFNSIQWKAVLSQSSYNVSIKEAVTSMGLSIFGKYIPGKFWFIVGRASYLSTNNKFPLSHLSMLSLNTQFISLWVGLIMGFLALFFFDGLIIWWIGVFIFWFVLTLTIFTPLFHSYTKKMIYLLFKRDLNIPFINIKSILSILKYFFLTWGLYSLAFYFFVVSMTYQYVPYGVGLGFPLSTTIGTVAIFTPGGLGVREGILTGFLNLNLSIEEALSISVASRLWFLSGELFLFLLANLFKWLPDKK